MRGWIILGLGAGVLYYLATETNKLDEPIARTDALLVKIERKLHAMTGTKIIKVDNKVSQLKKEISSRMSTGELGALDDILESEFSVQAYKDDFCNGSAPRHESLSRDNVQYICDKLR
ncbi:hypothetical protein FM038_024995 [Shewanella eurypsychrophilus]|uniref:Uncharacterized protein n=1 Tax=Shewanella eurypsychrophilus TaxID=2593656 RepID=A0ABX6VFJ8_9GAMM|nr:MULTISPECIES: hypothetical protein [Shewanella]QFU25053.1 hypothetical protein FS418_26615 [Shewanella sp. YLB-09]QPG60229.2 hypothetical protein FM038_024995 [Shewanella eurypsychrophilus]